MNHRLKFWDGRPQLAFLNNAVGEGFGLVLLEAQAAGIEATRTGRTLEEIHVKSVRTLTEGLVRLGLLSGAVDTLIEPTLNQIIANVAGAVYAGGA